MRVFGGTKLLAAPTAVPRKRPVAQRGLGQLNKLKSPLQNVMEAPGLLAGNGPAADQPVHVSSILGLPADALVIKTSQNCNFLVTRPCSQSTCQLKGWVPHRDSGMLVGRTGRSGWRVIVAVHVLVSLRRRGGR